MTNKYQHLIEHIKKHTPTLYLGSKTSTVIPFDKWPENIPMPHIYNLANIPGEINLNSDNTVTISGNINWAQMKAYLRSKNREILCYPTEELALVLSGLATSATGERSFSAGPIRQQVTKISYLDYNGQLKHLSADKDLEPTQLLAQYQKSFAPYKNFKNGPFPRMEKEIDLMIGTEGQLGVIIEASFKTSPAYQSQYLFALIPPWEMDDTIHLEIFKQVQTLRQELVIVELIDSHSLAHLNTDIWPHQKMDAIFFEIKEEYFESFFENTLSQVTGIDMEKVFEVSAQKFHQIRASVPRAVNEENARKQIIKQGTDIQVSPDNFAKLLDLYRDLAKSGIHFNLFGHFGDAHLHYNFLSTKDQVNDVQKKLIKLYQDVKKLHASPFAEHGIGLIKQKYIQDFWTNIQFQYFKELKQKHDPHQQFFPQGYMSLCRP